MQGYAVTALMPDDNHLWIGTQGFGLAEFSKSTGKLKLQDERNGLPDDWIRIISKPEGVLMAGTFVGGLAVYDGYK